MRIDVGAVTLEVAVHGSPAGPPVVLLHGWPDTNAVWRQQVPVLIEAGYRVVVPDLRGFGSSSKPEDATEYVLPNHIADVVGIMDNLEIERAHVVGHDWGGIVAWLMGTFAPPRIERLVTMSVGHPSALWTAGVRQRELFWYTLLFQFEGTAETWLSMDGWRNFREWLSHPDAEAVVQHLSDPAALRASLGIYRANLRPEMLISGFEVPPIECDVMAMWGSEDWSTSEEWMLGSSKFVKGEWRFERFEGEGHWLPLTATDAVNARLLDFLAD